MKRKEAAADHMVKLSQRDAEWQRKLDAVVAKHNADIDALVDKRTSQ